MRRPAVLALLVYALIAIVAVVIIWAALASGVRRERDLPPDWTPSERKRNPRP